jgi:hypothetical protein
MTLCSVCAAGSTAHLVLFFAFFKFVRLGILLPLLVNRTALLVMQVFIAAASALFAAPMILKQACLFGAAIRQFGRKGN